MKIFSLYKRSGIFLQGSRFRGKIFSILLLILSVIIIFSTPGCRNYDEKFDVVYFFKTEPEKAVLDFFQALDSKDPDFIYTNLLPDRDKNNISREKYLEEMDKVLSGVAGIEVTKIVYLGYENEMSKVVAKFEISYENGELEKHKKYIYLTEENGSWKI
ncbi:MAG: NTF2-like N-terminal transpeptidase domain-containing protein, partial [Actinomycetota bacterium]|nr:NTF2-like N-terminal transpeptidase domain-containing protein [Actinomycetota bacterium]